jgi:hypothetical protein
VEKLYSFAKTTDFDETWHDSLFMGHQKGVGGFIPKTEKDRKLFIASKIAFQIREAIYA